MTTSPSTSRRSVPATRLWRFRLAALALALAIGLLAAEAILHWRQGDLAARDRLDPGMIQYDRDLGWRLTPGWSGNHQHADFSARYSIHALGFRNDAPLAVGMQDAALTLLVGDSFTFGFGVNDDQTFVHRLQQTKPAGTWYASAAVPGYSTDQQALLVERRLIALRPGRIVLVVYLGNDLLDNLRPTPLQARTRKPRFELRHEGVELPEPFVPLVTTPPEPEMLALAQAVRGADPAEWSWRGRWEARSELFRLVSAVLLPAEDLRPEFPARFRPAVELFDAIVQRLARSCAQHGIELVIVPLAGRSHAEEPESVSAQFQEYFRAEVVRIAAGRGLPVIDVAARLQAEQRVTKAAWFFPNDGHLNPAGHEAVARILAEGLAALPASLQALPASL